MTTYNNMTEIAELFCTVLRETVHNTYGNKCSNSNDTYCNVTMSMGSRKGMESDLFSSYIRVFRS